MASLLSAWRQLDDARHRAELYRMWRAAAAAGFTVPRALETMGPRENPDVERLRRVLLDGARRGESVSSLVTAAGVPLPAFDASLLALGDESGRLEESLRLLADYYTRKHRWMLAVRKRMAYPMFTAVCATFVAPVPLLVGGHARAYAATVALGCVVWVTAGGSIVLAAAERFGRSPALVRARLARALASAITAGLPLDRALRLAAEASGDAGVRAHVGRIDDRRLVAQPLASSLAGCPHVTAELLAVLANAERTGDFAGTLTRLADLYDDGFR